MKNNLPCYPGLLGSLIFFLFLFTGCAHENTEQAELDELYQLFKDPPSESRPFVRWWWNGNCIEAKELERELDLLKAAGIGGVEINPIAHPDGTNLSGHTAYEWLSPEWNERLKTTLDLAKDRDMIVDLIMGSGWPFGGEFLEEEQWLQGVGIKKMTLEGPALIELDLKDIWRLPGRDFGSYNNPEAPEAELFFLHLLPQDAEEPGEIRDLMNLVDQNKHLRLKLPEGSHDLYIGTFQKAYRSVMHGAPGSKGPVVDHYDQADVLAYMDRLSEALAHVLRGKLGEHIRALFCDSIELSGANITDDFLEEFQKRRGYDLEPWISLVYYPPYEGYTDSLSYSPGFREEILRMRYDFNRTLVELFLERFTASFDRWANNQGMQSRYQAYGMPWLVGMLDGYRMVDIPESNNWLFSRDAKGHGYWIWNKYASSGAHLSGARLVGCEAMTNTRGVFRATLSMIKKNDDFNFITGINHSILHGYNYSPPEAGFPGWIRYGAYFSEQNSWWPYFRLWSDYNARLSAVFQHCDPVCDVAILTPEADIWQKSGLLRYPYYMHPWYHHDLWEGFSRNGFTADYINEGVIQRATAEKGRFLSENASYQLVLISSARSMEPESLEAIKKMAGAGVKFVFLEHFPQKSPGYQQYREKDLLVQSLVNEVKQFKSVSLTTPPASPAELTAWCGQLAHSKGIVSSIRPLQPHAQLYINKYKRGVHQLFFLSNQSENEPVTSSIQLDPDGTQAWIWDPESAERSSLQMTPENVLSIQLQPLESKLIVLGGPGSAKQKKSGKMKNSRIGEVQEALELDLEWQLEFQPVHGEPFMQEQSPLIDFSRQTNPSLRNFGGTVSYRSSFDLDELSWNFLDLGTCRHITEVSLNGKQLGIRWYGRHRYPLPADLLKNRNNQLEIRYTTTLANYANSLSDNEVVQRWIRLEEAEPMGLTRQINLQKEN